MPKRGKMPSPLAIREHWCQLLIEMGRFDSWLDLSNDNACFACGMDWGGTERSHILPHCDGGNEDVSNLHLLCHSCHKDSEYISGDEYWAWFEERTWQDAGLSACARAGILPAVLPMMQPGWKLETASRATLSALKKWCPPSWLEK